MKRTDTSRPLVAIAFLIAIDLHGVDPRQFDDARELHEPAQAAAPRDAGRQWAPVDIDFAIMLPSGLTYCPLPDDRNGMDRAQTFYAVPPTACRRGWPVQGGSRPSPSLHVEVWPNVDDATARDYAAHTCSRPRVLPVAVLEHPAIGCRVAKGDTVEISVFELIRVEHQAADAPPMGAITLTLQTLLPRLSADLKLFGAFTSGVYLCTRSANASDHRPRCPADGPW